MASHLGQRRPTIISPRDNRLKFKKAIEGDAVFFADLWQKGTDGEKEAVREDKYGESSVSVLH